MLLLFARCYTSEAVDMSETNGLLKNGHAAAGNCDAPAIGDGDLAICLAVLQRIADSHGTIPRSQRLNSLVAKLYRDGRRFELREQRQREEAEDRSVQGATAMVRIQRDALPAALALPAPADAPSRTLNEPETCYVCKRPYRDVHFFYHLLCPECAAVSYAMRDLHADLTGRTALVTGGRVKIGHQTVLRLLRDGARVLVTTRFPHSAAKRLHAEPDSADWLDRVQVYGLDLRNIPAVEAFAQHLIDAEPVLDIVIHNAAQTVRRPRGFYDQLVAFEQQPAGSLLPDGQRLVAQDAPSTLHVSDSRTLLPAALPDVGDAPLGDVLPADAFADNEERVDSRRTNSWLLRLDEVSAPEMLEVQLVNSVAPFLLNSRLKTLLLRSPHARRFIVNVSAMEGQFSRHKTVFHPHTNMAKAALNMMTRTSAEDYAKDGIYMNSVDTGWVTDENPTIKRDRLQEDLHFFPPLDIVDGMARIYHPIADGINKEEEPLYGLFLKDFAPCKW
jgi:NAD(P)-dependent dehydrogenase (short-subunit alcohol dehydrogenase family)